MIIPLLVSLLAQTPKPPVAAKACGEGLVLKEQSLGPLRLPGTVSVSALEASFRGCVVTVQCGQSDGPDAWYYSVKTADGHALFTITSTVEGQCPKETTPSEPTRIDAISVETPRIKDRHGVRIGMPYAEVVRRRPGRLEFGAMHHQVALGADKLFYKFWDDSEGDRSPVGVTREYVAKKNWKVTEISWPIATW
jgi:hypothetical protein